MNRAHAARRLLQHGPMSFAEFADVTGWPRGVCSRVLNYLTDRTGCVTRINRKYQLTHGTAHMSDLQKLEAESQPSHGGAPLCELFLPARVGVSAAATELREAPAGDAGAGAGSYLLGATGTEAKVMELIAHRQKLSIPNYGKTVAENPLPLRDWLQHQLEELLDAAIYAQRAIDELDARETLNLPVRGDA